MLVQEMTANKTVQLQVAFPPSSYQIYHSIHLLSHTITLVQISMPYGLQVSLSPRPSPVNSNLPII